MSRETLEHLNTNVLVGFTEKRRKAWHYRADFQTPWEVTMPDGSVLSGVGNHYPEAIPLGDVQARLFNWEAVSRRVAVEIPATFETMTHLTDDGSPMVWAVQDERQAMAASDDNAVFGLFKSGYVAHQYREWLLDSVATILDDDLQISSAGLLKGRAVAWVEVSVPENITTPEGVEFRPNLLATTSFDGTVATTFKRCVTNVVCDNTRDMAMSEAGQTFKARHSKYSGMKIGPARDNLAIVHTMADDFMAEVAAMCAVDVSDKDFTKILDELIPVTDDKGVALSKGALTRADTKRERIAAMYRNDNRCAPWNGTAYGVLQTLNTWTQHERPTRGDTQRAERNMIETINGSIGKADAEVMTAISKVLQLA
jgi:phage/plasmid-like protein (TIGR03299 family)